MDAAAEEEEKNRISQYEENARKNPAGSLIYGMRDTGREMTDRARESLKDATPKDMTFWQDATVTAVRSLGITLPGILASVATRSPAPALGAMGLAEFGSSFDENIRAGMDPDKARQAAIMSAGVEAYTEVIPLNKLLSLLPKQGMSIFKKMVKMYLPEIAQENIATLGQDAIQFAAKNPGATFKDWYEGYIKNIPEQAARTTASTLISSTIQTGGAQAAHSLLRSSKKEMTDAEVFGGQEVSQPVATPEPTPQQAKPAEQTGGERQPVLRRAFAPDGSYVDTAFEIADANEIPATRTEAAQGEINMADLGDAATMDRGAPVVGPGNALEGGNQQASVIKTAYETDKGQPYKQWLMDNAEQFGLSRTDIEAMDRPMLVRRRISEAVPSGTIEPTPAPTVASPAVRKIQDAISPITAKWKNGPTVNVVQSVSELPDKAAPHDVEGAYLADGQIYLVADNLPTAERAKQVLAHEAIGHAGFEKVMGAELPAVLSEIDRLEKTEKSVRDAAKTVDENQPGLDKTTRAKEIIAVMAENGVQNSVIRRVINAIRKFLREAGIDIRLDANDIAGFLMAAEKSLEKPSVKQQPAKQRPAKETKYSRKVYTEPKEYQELYAEALKESRSQDRSKLSPGQKPGRTVEGQAPRERWHQETVVRGIDGRLSIVFRGSHLRLTEDHFAFQSLGHNTKHPTSGLGVWLTMSQKEAPRFGPTVESFYLDIRNPAIFKPGSRDLPVYDLVKQYYQYRERLRERGFDAIVLDMRDLRGTMHFAVFDPGQVIHTRPLYSRKKGAQDQTETPEFKKWFGDSKVVDENGKPLVVYHGTASTDITEFKPQGDNAEKALALFRKAMKRNERFGYMNFRSGSFFSPHPDYAGNYTAEDTGVMYPVYIKAENPIYFDQRTSNVTGVDPNKTPDALIMMDGDVINEVAVIDPKQVKSATGNRGTFDPNDPNILFSRKKEIVVGNSGRQYTKAQMEAMKATGSVMTPVRLQEVMKDAWTGIGKKMAQGIVDQFAPVRELSKNAYMLLRLSKGATGAFEAFMNNGKLSVDREGVYDADTSGGVMKRLFIPLGKETTDFLRWIAGNRAERLMKEGREHLFSKEHISAFKSLSEGQTDFDYTLQNGTTTRNRRAIYQDSLDKFNEFNRNIMDVAEQSGLIDSESRHLWEHEFYVPFYRVQQEDGGIRGMNIKSGVVRQEAFKRLKGGKEQLNDLLMSTLMNWSHLINASAKNRAAKATLQAAERAGVARRASSSEKGTVWYMGRTEVVLPDGTKTSVFMKNYYKVNDPHVLTAITALEYAGMRNPAMNALSAFKHWLTIGVTASPFFKVRNLIRDSMQAIATSELSYNVLGNIATGALATRKGTQEYTSALAAGGLIRFGTMLEGNETERTRHLIAKGAAENQILDNQSKIETFLDKTVYPLVAAYNELGNRGEEINRMALYRQMVAKGMPHGEAALAARDLLDFSMAGAWNSIRFLAQTVPFMNARLQGLYKLGRAANENPARFSAVVGATALVSIAMLLAYQDDDDWKKREDWDRDNYWWFKIGGIAFRIPKPFEIGAIASLAERSVELWVSDEMTRKRFLSRVAHVIGDQLSMNPTPQLIKPIIDLYANKDSFTDRPIEPLGMERLKKDYRFTANTSMFARAASTGTGGKVLSPIQIDYLVRSYFGWLGSFVVQSGDLITRPFSGDPRRPAPDYFKKLSGGMVQKLEGAPSRYVSQVYEQSKILEESYGTYMHLLKKRKREDAEKFKEKHQGDIKMAPYVEAMKRAMSGYNQMIRQIELRDELSSEEKTMKINQIKERKHTMAKRFDQRLREYENRRSP